MKQTMTYASFAAAESARMMYEKTPNLYTAGEVTFIETSDGTRFYQMTVDYHPTPITETRSQKLQRLASKYEHNPELDYLVTMALLTQEHILDVIDDGDYPSMDTLDSFYDEIVRLDK